MLDYNRAMIERDIVYFYHNCADYHSIASDLLYGSALAGPYYSYLDSEDTFLRVGCTLIFLGMLIDWDDDSGFAFVTSQGVTRHPLDFYLIRFLYLYEQARTTPDAPMRDIYDTVMHVLAQIARREDNAPILERLLDTRLRDRLQQAIKIYESEVHPPIDERFKRLYETYIHPYFRERSG